MIVHISYPHCHFPGVRFNEESRSADIGDIQKLLTQRGFYYGPINNCYDANTAEALSRFQESIGLAVTGNINPETFCRLHSSTSFTLNHSANHSANTAFPRANILITKSNRQLTLFDGNHPLRQFPVAIGKPSTPTPEGNFAIATKIVNPGGVLGSRWMGLNYGAYGIHGTNAPWAIGTMISHGCIRMHNNDADELFSHVSVGTPVFIRN